MRISELTAVTVPAGTDTIPVVQGGVTKKETISQLVLTESQITNLVSDLADKASITHSHTLQEILATENDAANTPIFMSGGSIFMNNGSGSGGGSITMDAGAIDMTGGLIIASGGIRLEGNLINMNDGSGTGGNAIKMDRGSIQDTNAIYVDYIETSSVDGHITVNSDEHHIGNDVWMGSKNATFDGGHIYMEGGNIYGNNSLSGGGSIYTDGGNIYLSSGGGSGGGNLYMEGGVLEFPSGASSTIQMNGNYINNCGFLYFDGTGGDIDMAGGDIVNLNNISPTSSGIMSFYGPNQSRNLLTLDDSTGTIDVYASTNLNSYSLAMNNGGGTGGGTLYMDGGDISMGSGTIDFNSGTGTIAQNGSVIDLEIAGGSIRLGTNTGFLADGNNVYMATGSGSGGGNLFMDAGILSVAGGTIDATGAVIDLDAGTISFDNATRTMYYDSGTTKVVLNSSLRVDDIENVNNITTYTLYADDGSNFVYLTDSSYAINASGNVFINGDIECGTLFLTTAIVTDEYTPTVANTLRTIDSGSGSLTIQNIADVLATLIDDLKTKNILE